MNKSIIPIIAPTLLLITIAIIQFFTMPRFLYPGDNYAPRIEGEHWLNSGSLAMPYAMKPQLGGFLEQRGQYFYENDEKQTLTSKYGFGNTLAYLVPTLAERHFSGPEKKQSAQQTTIWFINLWQIIITLGFILYFYLAMGLFSSRPILRCILILTAVYSTFLWHYLRSPTLEIFQILPYTASFYHMVKYLRNRAQSPKPAYSCWLHLAAAVSFASLLVWFKPFFAVNCLIIAAFAVTAGNGTLTARIGVNVRKHARAYCFSLILPALFFAGVVLFINDYKFGSPLTTGYSQWLKNGVPHDRFSLSLIPKALSGFFIKPGNANLFLHYPLLIPALFSLPLLWKLKEKGKFLLAALATTNILLLCTFSIWSGEWCYGPRYLLHTAVLLTLPLPLLTEKLIQLKVRWPKYVVAALIIPALIWSLMMQININSLNYFVYYQTKSVYRSFKQPDINEYFTSHTHRGQLHKALIEHKIANKTFPPQQILSSRISPQHKQVINQLETFLSNQTEWNYYFLRDNEKPPAQQ